MSFARIRYANSAIPKINSKARSKNSVSLTGPALTGARYIGNQNLLSVNRANDSKEAEADRAAASLPNLSSLQKTPKTDVPKKTIDRSSPVNRSSSISSHLSSSGNSIKQTEKTFFESHFQQNFDDVQIHTGSAAATAAERLQAKAFTLGNHIVFGAGEYQPESDQGRRLFAHELTHVIQQRGQSEACIQRQPAAGSVDRPEPEGVPYTFMGCTDAEYRILEHTIRQSYLMVRHAHNSILNYILSMLQADSSPQHDVSRFAISLQSVLNRDFGARNLSDVSEIRDNLSRMFRKLRSGLTIECHHEATRNLVAEAETPGRRIWIGPRFFTHFDDSLQSRPRVFIHELAHAIGVGHDMSGLALEAGREQSEVGEFAHHADSYAVLAYRLYTGDLWNGLDQNSDI